MTTKSDHAMSIREVLLKEMKTGIYAECERLPRETVLSEELGISRTQLRDVLPDLEREGFITRRHGIGTVINRHVLNVRNRMDIETEFLDIIRQNGHEAAMSYIEVIESTATANMAEKLFIDEGTPVIRIRLVCSADGKPAIYCEDVLEQRLVTKDYTHENYQVIVFKFLEKFCDVEAYMDLTHLHAVLADDETAEKLEVEKGTPLLNMEEIDYDIDGNPIFYSRQYFVDEYFQHTVLRKKF